jgi:hypothetical protein
MSSVLCPPSRKNFAGSLLQGRPPFFIAPHLAAIAQFPVFRAMRLRRENFID